jgi:hypothetical protein
MKNGCTRWMGRSAASAGFVARVRGCRDHGAGQTRMRANLYRCKRTGRACEGEKTDIFAQTLENGISRHASFIEIYEHDAADPALAPLLAAAHAKLLRGE